MDNQKNELTMDENFKYQTIFQIDCLIDREFKRLEIAVYDSISEDSEDFELDLTDTDYMEKTLSNIRDKFYIDIIFNHEVIVSDLDDYKEEGYILLNIRLGKVKYGRKKVIKKIFSNNLDILNIKKETEKLRTENERMKSGKNDEQHFFSIGERRSVAEINANTEKIVSDTKNIIKRTKILKASNIKMNIETDKMKAETAKINANADKIRIEKISEADKWAKKYGYNTMEEYRNAIKEHESMYREKVELEESDAGKQAIAEINYNINNRITLSKDKEIPNAWIDLEGKVIYLDFLENHESSAHTILKNMNIAFGSEDSDEEYNHAYEKLQTMGYTRVMGWAKAFIFTKKLTKKQVAGLKYLCQTCGVMYPDFNNIDK